MVLGQRQQGNAFFKERTDDLEALKGLRTGMFGLGREPSLIVWL